MGKTISTHTPPDTTDADTSTPQRFVHRSLARTPRCSEAYLHWRSAPLSTMYIPTTSESLAGDSSSESSTGPSRKRCRSHAAILTSSIHATRALVPSRADLLPPRKRFRDSISPEDSVEEDIDMDVLEDIEANATAVEVAVDRDVEARVNAGIDMEVDVRIGVEDEVEDEVESIDRGTAEVGVDLAAGIDIPDGMLMPDAVERLEQVEEGQRELESRSLIAGGERASLLEQVASLERINNMTITRSAMTPKAIEELVSRIVEEKLATIRDRKSSLTGILSSESSTGPSRKRCRSHAAILTSSIHATRALVPSRADLLPPRKRFRDSISPEGYARVNADLAAGIDIPDAMLMPDAVEHLEQVEEGQRELESRSLIAGGERASLLEQVASLERINVKSLSP
ncbi:hypothetical protein Tco_1570882 [Tanacetum coccineum]